MTQSFLDETLDAIEKNGLSEKDIKFVSYIIRRNTKLVKKNVRWEDFKSVASRRYKNSLGLVYVNTSLRIVFPHGLLQRFSYTRHGEEWWAYKKLAYKNTEVIFSMTEPADFSMIEPADLDYESSDSY